MQFTDTSERGFQQFIANYLVTQHHFTETNPQSLTEICFAFVGLPIIPPNYLNAKVIPNSGLPG
jgi:hypothetical protein